MRYEVKEHVVTQEATASGIVRHEFKPGVVEAKDAETRAALDRAVSAGAAVVKE